MTVQRPARPPTHRQEQVARLAAYGKGYKEIAIRLKISPRTVRRHVEELALLIPLGEDEDFEPLMRVTVWAYWEYRIKPGLSVAA